MQGVSDRVQGVSEWSLDSRHVHPVFDLAGVHEERVEDGHIVGQH